MEQEGKQMSFLGHLEELRWRLVRAAIAVLVFAVVIFIFIEELMEYVYLPLANANFVTYSVLCDISQATGMDDSLCANSIKVNFQSIEMMGQFSTHIFVSIVGGIACAFPFLFYQLWGFIKPGLNEKEMKSSKGVIYYGSLLFILGILFGYFLISPLTVQFFGNYQISPLVHNNFTINSYLSTVTTTTFACGLLFQLPIVVYILSKIGILTPEFLKKYRKHAFVIVLILSAIITPPDVISQIIVTIPIMLLYEVGIGISRRVNARRAKEQ